MLTMLNRYSLQTMDEILAAAVTATAAAIAAKGTYCTLCNTVFFCTCKSTNIMFAFLFLAPALQLFSISIANKTNMTNVYTDKAAVQALPRGAVVQAARLCEKATEFFPGLQLSAEDVAALAGSEVLKCTVLYCALVLCVCQD